MGNQDAGRAVSFRWRVVIGLSALLFATSLHAAGEVKKRQNRPYDSFYLSANIGGYLFAGSEHLREIASYGVKVGYETVGRSLLDSLGVEASYTYLGTSSTRQDGDVTGHLFRVDAIYPFNPRSQFVPFIAVGAGGITLTGPTQSSLDPLLNYGGGAKYMIADYLALRGDVRHLLIYHDGHTRNNVEALAGLSWYFGREPRTQVPIVPAGKGPDVPVKLTRTPDPVWPMEGTVLEKLSSAAMATNRVVYPPLNRFPAAPVAAPLAPPFQAIPDGEPAASPPALSTPLSGAAPGAPVQVPAGQEPQPPAVTQMESTTVPPAQPVQRPIGQRVSRSTRIGFDRGSSTIKPEYYQDLIDISVYLKTFPDSVLIIEGHGDDQGDQKVNRRLSRQREQSTIQKLTLFGIEPERLFTGEDESITIGGRPREHNQQRGGWTLLTIKPFAGPQ